MHYRVTAKFANYNQKSPYCTGTMHYSRVISLPGKTQTSFRRFFFLNYKTIFRRIIFFKNLFNIQWSLVIFNTTWFNVKKLKISSREKVVLIRRLFFLEPTTMIVCLTYIFGDFLRPRFPSHIDWDYYTIFFSTDKIHYEIHVCLCCQKS